MKKTWLFIPLFIGILWAEDFTINDLSGGVYSNASVNKIPDNSAQLIQNFFTDVEPIAIERNGFEKRDTTVLGDTKAVEGLWEFVDISGNEWIVSFSSRSFYKNTVGNTPTKFGPTMTVAQIPECASNLGKFMCVNGTDSAWTFDGTSTAAVAGAPLGKLIVAWRNRFVISNITSSQSTVRFSADGDQTTWTLGGNATDPFSLQIGGANDGFNVTCLWGSYLDNLIISRKRDIWAVAGFDQLDIVNRNVSSEIGCIQNGSMREFDGSLIFLSNRGLEEMRGSVIQHISEPIRDITDTIVTNTSQERRNLQTSQAQWQAGTSTPSLNLSTTELVGSITTLTTSFSLTTSADFDSTGTVTDNGIYLDTETVSGQMQTTFPDLFTSLRNGGSGTKNVWTTSIQNWTIGNPTPDIRIDNNRLVLDASIGSSNFQAVVRTTELTHDITTGATFFVTIASASSRDTGGAGSITDFPRSFQSNPHSDFFLILSTTVGTEIESDLIQIYGGSGFSPYWYAVFFSTTNGQQGPILFEQFANNDDGVTNVGSVWTLPATIAFYIDSSNYRYTINGTVASSGTHTWSLAEPVYAYMAYAHAGTAPDGTEMKIDDFTINPQTFTYTTTWDTAVSSASWGTFSGTFASSVTFGTQASDDAASFDSEVAVTTGSLVTSDTKRYVKINTKFNDDRTVFPGTVDSNVQDFSLTAGSTGTFTSQVFEVGTLITGWGPILINDDTDGGSITYQFNSTGSADINDFTQANWETVTSGQVPTISTGQYAAFRADFAIDAATHTVSIQDFTTNWSEGDIQPLKSWNHNRRYWLSYTTATASNSRNNRILVYQRNRTWTLLKGINAGSFATWRDNLYFGDSNDNGYVYKYGVGNNDDGSNIQSIIDTKSYDLGTFSLQKSFMELYLNFNGNTNFSGSFDVSYALDSSDTSYSLGTMNHNEALPTSYRSLPFPISNRVEGQEIRYRIIKDDQTDRLKLYDLTTVFDLKRRR